MLDIVTANKYNILSSGMSAKYLIESVFPVADFGDENVWVDVHSKTALSLFALPRTLELTYNNMDVITSVSQRVYGTTTLWWFIVGCSDYLHPHQIPTGSTILLPSLLSVTGKLAANAIGLRNQVVSI